ncbi:putative G-protein beta WD-40 repeat-containing protein [Xylogone sp. PMI_703]|nr:putative G-protein beta WD-40 repeat-containing protein [Xylogone sp. PMI_703]
MTEPDHHFTHDDYTVGWICALPETELVAAEAMLDEIHPVLPAANSQDTNSYSLGKIGAHNVVIACLPAETTGKVSAATVANNMVHSFKSVRFGLMVGIGGGAPYYGDDDNAEDDDTEDGGSEDIRDIRLGDVVISLQTKSTEAVVQYDFGKSVQGGKFLHIGGKLNKPPPRVLSAISVLKSKHQREGHSISKYLREIGQKYPRIARKFKNPGLAKDRLFKRHAVHIDGKSCKACCGPADVNLVKRRDRDDDSVHLHYGTIGSADQVMRDALLRDEWAKNENIICFEMEAAGLMDSFPCLVIRGICDYADTHKNKIWQPYAAATAAAYAKELLLVIPKQDVHNIPPIIEQIRSLPKQIESLDNKIEEVKNAFGRSEQAGRLKELPIASGAAFDMMDNQHNQCLEGTRIELLEQIQKWAGDTDSKHVFWLKGIAGTGKSTLAHTVAHMLQSQDFLVASFSFSRGIEDRRHAKLLFTSLAYQLAVSDQSIRQQISEALSQDPGIVSKNLREQWASLICKPLQKSGNNMCRSVIVVDALDECEKDEEIRSIIANLTRREDLGPVQLRIFITSRPEIVIRHGFDKTDKAIFCDLSLNSVPRPIIERDISIFIKYHMNEIRETRMLKQEWPGEQKILIIARRADRLFIYAATLCRFLAEARYPTQCLEEVLKSSNTTGSPIGNLDNIYSQILDRAIPRNDYRIEKNRFLSLFRTIVGSIVVLFNPLSARNLADMFNIAISDVTATLDPLHSILDIPKDVDSPIQLFHLSFRDFLVDPEKHGTNPFWIDEKKAHETLLVQCLTCLLSLKKDICNLQAPGTLQADVKQDTIKKYLPAELQYACLYWVDHLKASGTRIRDDDQIYQLLKKYLLCWLEALSLLGRTSESVRMIDELQNITESSECIETRKFLHDARRFILNYRSIIDRAPLQLYSSALLFAPKKSLVRKVSEHLMSPWIITKPEMEDDWNSCSQTIGGYSEVSALAFSPNMKLLALGLAVGKIIIWDVVTGQEMQAFEGNRGASISRLIFSADSAALASMSYRYNWGRSFTYWGGIKLRDIMTGHEIEAFESGENCALLAFTFTPDAEARLAREGGDGSIEIWDMKARRKILTLNKCRDKPVDKAEFSADSKLLLIEYDLRKDSKDSEGYEDSDYAACEIQIWDILEGRKLFTDIVAMRSRYERVLSADFRLMAVSAEGYRIEILEIATGQVIQTISEGVDSSIRKFSNNSKLLIVSGSHRISIWDVATGQKLCVVEDSSWGSDIVELSAGCQLLVTCGRMNRTVKIWDVTARPTTQMLPVHPSNIYSVEFLLDLKLLVSQSREATKVWDAQTGRAIREWDGRHWLSPDFTYRVYSPAGMVEVWSVATGHKLHEFSGSNDQWVAGVSWLNTRVVALQYNRDGNRLWDAAQGRQITGPPDLERRVTMALSTDSKFLACGVPGGWTIRIWDVADGEMINEIEVESLGEMAFSSYSRLLAFVDVHFNNEKIVVWDLTKGQQVQSIRGRGGGLGPCRLSFDATDTHLYTNWEAVALDPASPFKAYQVSRGGRWIKCNGQNLLWLPPEYVLLASAVGPSAVAIGCESGRVLIFGFTSDHEIHIA